MALLQSCTHLKVQIRECQIAVPRCKATGAHKSANVPGQKLYTFVAITSTNQITGFRTIKTSSYFKGTICPNGQSHAAISNLQSCPQK